MKPKGNDIDGMALSVLGGSRPTPNPSDQKVERIQKIQVEQKGANPGAARELMTPRVP